MNRLLTLVIICPALAGCGGPGEGQGMVAEYQRALERTAGIATVVPGSPEESEALARVKALLGRMSENATPERIRAVYAPAVYFNDTLKTVEGIDALEHYLVETAERVGFVVVEFDDVARSGRDYYLRWRMDYQAERVSGGQTVRSIGVSQVRFDASGRVVLHQDFWDSGGGFFEHLPVLGWMIRSLKARL